MYQPKRTAVKKFAPERPTACAKETKPKHCTCAYTTHFCRTTANHGFVHLVDANEGFYIKIGWSLVLLTFACIVTVMIYISVLNLCNPKLRTEFLEDTDYEGNHSYLPDIHICDTSVFNATRLKNMGFNDTMATYLRLATTDNAAVRHLVNNKTQELIFKEELDSILAKQSLTMKMVFENATTRCEEIVYGCSYAEEFFYKHKCCEKFFPAKPFVSVFGSCISTKGVYLSNNKFDNNIIKTDYILPQGVYYAVSSSTVHLQMILPKNGRYANPNSWNSVPITKTKIDNSELRDNAFAPYRCVDTKDSIVIKNISPGYNHYSKENCYLEFWQTIFRNYSNCSEVFYEHDDATRLCKPHDFLTADYSLQVPYPKDCQVTCTEELYEVSPSSTNFNEDSFLKSFPTVNTDKTEMVSLHFFYHTFRYQVRKVHTNTFLQWLGEIGGNLGLFLGASLISLLEIVLVCFRCCIKRSL